MASTVRAARVDRRPGGDAAVNGRSRGARPPAGAIRSARMDLTAEEVRLRDADAGCRGASWAPTSASASGARSARTTATTATPGRTSPTTRPARGPTAGARTAWPGISDDKQRLCFALALWNEQDPILKERLFGLTNAEGNHGEDVKEYYFYVDNLPTHSYQRWLYKYPQAAFPYDDLVADQPPPVAPRDGVRAARHGRLRRRPLLRRRGRVRQGRARRHPVPHHRAQPRARGRADPPAADAVVPQHVVVAARTTRRPSLRGRRRRPAPVVRADHHELGTLVPPRRAGDAELLFCENETQRGAAVGRRRPAAVPEGRHQRPRRARRARRVNPDRRGHQGGGPRARSSCRPAARRSTSRAARRDGRRPSSADPFADVDDCVAAAARRGRRVLRRDHARTASTTTPPR